MDESRHRAIAERAASLQGQAGPTGLATPVDEAEDGARLLAVRSAFSALTDAEIEPALNGDNPDRRLAACWRWMLRQQSLPTAAPDDGVRLLLLVNLATVQAIDVLETLVALDPCASVRAAAATLLWRVARDRDRVVDGLIARLECERSVTVLESLLRLDPSLPIERVRATVRHYADHPAAEVRGAAETLWHRSGGASLSPYDDRRHSLARARAFALWSTFDLGDVDAFVVRVRGEAEPEVRACVLGLWARSAGYAGMLRCVADPVLRDASLEAWARHGRRVPFGELAHLLAEADPHAVSSVLTGPYPPGARDRLLAITGAYDLGTAPLASPELLRCLTEASQGIAPPPDLGALRSRLAAAEARCAASRLDVDGDEDGDDDWHDDDEDGWHDDDHDWQLHDEVDTLRRILHALGDR